jgi:ABC-type phosphate transport system substrate-binding protein
VTVVVPAMSALAGTVLILGGLTACSGGAASTPSASPASGPALPTTPAAAPQKLSETGSSLMAPLFTQWGPAYHAQFPQGEAALGNSAGNYVLPTASTIQAGLASFTNTPANETMSLINGSGAQVYPTINYEYAIVSISQPSTTRAQDLRAFLNWTITTGTAQLAQVNFQPLPPSVVMLSQAQIAKIEG